MSDIAFSSSMRTPTIYEKIIHPKLGEKLRLYDDEDLLQEKDDAQFLEQQFNEIKNIIVNGIMPSRGNKAGLEALFTEDIMNRLASYNLFNYLGVPRYNAANQGVAFEEDLARIIYEVIGRNDQDIENSLETFLQANLTGRQSGESLRFSEDAISKILQIPLSKGIKNIDTHLTNAFKQNIDEHSGEIYYTMVARSIKADFVPNKETVLPYTFGDNAILERFYNILTTASFSAKNYLVSSLAKGINLGNAAETRQILNSLAYIGYDSEESGSLFGRTINYRNNRKKGYDIVETHLKHLKFAYELMGIGQGVEAKFLIINTRLTSGYEQALISKALQRSFNVRDTMRGDILVLSNRWLVKQVYNAILEDISVSGTTLFIS